jgi:hypothetical protein
VTATNHRWLLLAWFLAAAVLFLVTNRAAYKGYFSDDDLDNLGWPTYVDSDVYYHGLTTPKFDENNFRPVGDLYYRYLYRAFRLRFPVYVGVLQSLHLLNAILLFFLLGRLGFSDVAAGASAVFYMFHAAALEAYWKPMYVFDVVCCTLCLVTCLMYLRGHWILALVPFWLAYKSKEVAIMLPVALLAYELLLGQRKWKPLIPYFAVSLNFGLQALWWNRHLPQHNPYALTFTPHGLWNTVAAYSSSILFLPLAGMALLLLPIFLRDRRLYLGLILMGALLAPMLALPGRVENAYWYTPMIGLGVVVAAIASRMPRWAIAVVFILWFPLNYMVLREKRRSILAIADEDRWYTTGLLDFARRTPKLEAVVYEGIPGHLGRWGVDGAIHLAFGPQVKSIWYHDSTANAAMAQEPMAMVSYYPAQRLVRGLLQTHNVAGGQSYIQLRDETQDSQLGAGWYERIAGGRETAAQAVLTLFRPAGASQFEISAWLPQASGPKDSSAKVTVFENGRSMGTAILTRGEKPSLLRWNVPAGSSGVCDITILTEPAWRAPGDSRDLGAVVYSAGYGSP